MKRVLMLFLFLLASSTLYSQVGDSHIKVDQFGYRTNAKKIAVTSSSRLGYNSADSFVPGNIYEVWKKSNSTVVFSDGITQILTGNTDEQSGDVIWWFDFSQVTDPDEYFVYDPDNQVASQCFIINDNIYTHVLKVALRSYYYQRCGVPKLEQYGGPWNDPVACHSRSNQDQKCRLVTDKNNAALEKDLTGGWHDAGDYNKYTTWYDEVIPHLLLAYKENPSVFKDNYNIPESGNGIPDILDEVKFGLDYLQKLMDDSGRVIIKVSTSGFKGASPPSADNNPRYYGPAQNSASTTTLAIFALAYLVYKDIPALADYADTLLAKAILAMNYVNAHPDHSHYNNNGFSTANPEYSEYGQKMSKIAACIYLFAATGNTAYRDFVDANYASFQPYQWTYWYTFEYNFQRDFMFYTSLPGATPSVVNTLKNSFKNSLEGSEFLRPVLNKTDGYRAYLKPVDMTWGSNGNLARVGCMYSDAITYGINPTRETLDNDVAEDVLHHLHGIKPFISTTSLILSQVLSPLKNKSIVERCV